MAESKNQLLRKVKAEFVELSGDEEMLENGEEIEKIMKYTKLTKEEIKR